MNGGKRIRAVVAAFGLLASWTYTLAYKRTPGDTLLEYICGNCLAHRDEQR